MTEVDRHRRMDEPDFTVTSGFGRDSATACASRQSCRPRAADRQAEFVEALRGFRSVRQRDGAVRWDVWEDVAEPGRIMESFVVESWIEHQRQHSRVTRTDQLDQATLNNFHVGDGPPVVRHLLRPP